MSLKNTTVADKYGPEGKHSCIQLFRMSEGMEEESLKLFRILSEKGLIGDGWGFKEIMGDIDFRNSLDYNLARGLTREVEENGIISRHALYWKSDGPRGLEKYLISEKINITIEQLAELKALKVKDEKFIRKTRNTIVGHWDLNDAPPAKKAKQVLSKAEKELAIFDKITEKNRQAAEKLDRIVSGRDEEDEEDDGMDDEEDEDDDNGEDTMDNGGDDGGITDGKLNEIEADDNALISNLNQVNITLQKDLEMDKLHIFQRLMDASPAIAEKGIFVRFDMDEKKIYFSTEYEKIKAFAVKFEKYAQSNIDF